MTPSLTIVGAFVTGEYVDATAAAILRTQKALPFQAEHLLISDRPSTVNMPRVAIPEEWLTLPHEDVYSAFMVQCLADYIKTDFALTVQWDGFGLHAKHWSDEFFKWDYIGAPWWNGINFKRVGNGGLSLRSRKWLELGRTAPAPAYEVPEDCHMCRIALDHWTSHGCKVAPVETAIRFALQKRQPDFPNHGFADSWGFHGFRSPKSMELWPANS